MASKGNARAHGFALWLLVAFLLVIAGSSAAAAGPLLRYLAKGPRTAPVWIDAEAATNASGTIDWQLFEESERDLAATPPEIDPVTGDCLTYLGEPSMDRLEPKPNGSLEDLERHSLAIYVGTVEEIRPGFWSGIPYSLLAVKVTEVFRSSASIASDFVYVPVPTANFSLGGRRYCTDGTRGYRPKLGDRALLFLYDPALDTAKSLVFPRFGETVFESAPGRLVFDPGLKKQDDWMAAATFDDVLRFLRSTSTHTGQ